MTAPTTTAASSLAAGLIDRPSPPRPCLATVYRLPGAGGPAVQQHPRCGRHSKCVLSLWRARFDRAQAAEVLALEAQLKVVLQARHECFQRCAAFSREEKEFERRNAALTMEFDLLAKQVKAIEAQIAQAAKEGVT